MNVETMNTILYCEKWRETTAFYRNVLGFQTKTESDWLVEFAVVPTACLSVADAKRTSIRTAGGAGITLTFKVADLRSLWQTLVDQNISVDPIRHCRMGGQAFFLHDPEGNRLEFWFDPSGA
jgi:catechol-2,3-dioxygenase